MEARIWYGFVRQRREDILWVQRNPLLMECWVMAREGLQHVGSTCNYNFATTLPMLTSTMKWLVTVLKDYKPGGSTQQNSP